MPASARAGGRPPEGRYRDLGLVRRFRREATGRVAAPACPQRSGDSLGSLLVPAANAASASSPVPDITLKDVASFVHTPVNMDDFQVVVDSGKNEVDNATTLLLGVIFFANGDTQQALAYYDRALAASTAGASSGDGKIVGQEVIYFERATALYQENRLPEAIADLQTRHRRQERYVRGAPQPGHPVFGFLRSGARAR